MKIKGLIVIVVALLNVLIIGIVPKSYYGASITSESQLTDRHKSIVESLKNGLSISMEDSTYLREQSDFLVKESLESAQKNSKDGNRLRLSTESILLVSGITLVTLVFLVVFRLFRRFEYLVYFSFASMLVFLISPIGSGQLFLIIMANMAVIFSGLSLFKLMNK